MTKVTLPYVSVIIPSYNRLSYTIEAIESVLAQDFKHIPETMAGFEIVVVFDGGYELYQRLIIKKFLAFPEVRFFTKDNGGVSSALNFGIKMARGKFISWLSDDDLMETDHLRSMVGKLLSIDWNLRMIPSVVYGGWKVVNEKNEIIDWGQAQNLLIPKNLQSNQLYPLLKSRIHGCSLLIEKSLFNRYGGFDEKQLTTGDYHKWFVIFQKANLYLAEYDQNTIRSRAHQNQDSHSKNKVHIEECNKLWTYFSECFASIKEGNQFNSWDYLICIYDHIKNSAYSDAFENLHTISKINTPYQVFVVEDEDIYDCFKSDLNSIQVLKLVNWAVINRRNGKYCLYATNIPNELMSDCSDVICSNPKSCFFKSFPILGGFGIVSDYDVRVHNLQSSPISEIESIIRFSPW